MQLQKRLLQASAVIALAAMSNTASAGSTDMGAEFSDSFCANSCSWVSACEPKGGACHPIPCQGQGTSTWYDYEIECFGPI